MLLIPSKLLIIILALLQLVAPLVHAHTHGEDSKQGFHLPELEVIIAHNNEPFIHEGHHHSHDCSIISIKQGIKNNKKSDGVNSHSLFFLSFYLLKVTDNYSANFDSVFRNQPLSRISLNRTLSTRAPPTETS